MRGLLSRAEEHVDQGLIDWKRIDRDRFDRLVELLLYRKHPETAGVRVEVLDGRGGDDGIDVGVYVGGVLDHVYQLKYFPEGMSGGHSGRRQQVRKSFTRATKLGPRLWTLVTPGNLTAQERRFVKGLQKDEKVVTDSMGRVELDNELSRWDDLQRASTREPLLEALRTVGMERAALATPGDLHERAAAFGAQIDGRSAFWRTAVTVDGPNITSVLHAKHPRASELEPLSINLTANPAALDAATRKKLDDLLGYGLGTKVVLPADAVASLKLIGPEWFAAEYTQDVSIEIHSHPLARVPVKAELREVDTNDRVLTTWRGSVTDGGTGGAGGSLAIAIPGGVEVTFKLPTDKSNDGRIDVTRARSAASPRDVHRALRLLSRIDARARFDLVLDGQQMVRFAAKDGTYTGTDDPYWMQVADDMIVIERELDLDLRMPMELTSDHRIAIRTLRLLLDGHCVLMPDVGAVPVSLTGEYDSTFEEFLARDSGAFAFDSSYSFELDGTLVVLEGIKSFHPRMRVANGAEALERLRAGTGAGFTLHFEPLDGTPFRAFDPERWKDDSAPLSPSKLEIPGADEHPAIAAIHRESATRPTTD